MFDSLSERLGGILDRLTRRGALSEADVDAALREVRRALLEADVALDVARAFIEKVKGQAVGVEVIKSVTPGQMVVKIVHDQLIETLGARGEAIDLNAPAPVPIMLVGLQGSGKTTTAAKIAKRLSEQMRRKVLMASLDVRRPAAMEQLAVLGKQIGIETCRSSRASSRRRSRSARCKPAGSAATTWCCSTPPAAPPSTRMMAEAARGQARRQAARGAAGRRRAHRPGRGQPRARFDERVGPHRHRAPAGRRRRPRRRRALDAGGDRQADQADRHRRAHGRARGLHPARIADRILGMGDIVSVATVTVLAAGSQLSLPVRAAVEQEGGLRHFPPAERHPGGAHHTPARRLRAGLRLRRRDRYRGRTVDRRLGPAADRGDRPRAGGDRAQGLPDPERRSAS